MTNFKRLSLMTVAACALIAPVAVGQTSDFYSRTKYEAVLDRMQPEFDPEPIRLRTFLVTSMAEASISSNDNVFATSGNEQSDVIARIGADVSATTDWSVHAVGFDVSAYRNEYLDLTDESTNELEGRLRGRLDVTRSFSLGAAVFAQQGAEARTDIVNAFGVDAPVEFMRTGAVVSADYQNDRVRWNNSLGVTEEDYEDGNALIGGANIDQDYRDRSLTEGRTRLSYAISPDLAVFGQATYLQSEYDNLQNIGGLISSRNTQGYTIAGGVDFELSALIRGDIAVGYLNEDKEDDNFEDITGLSADARLQWFPTRLTTFNFSAGRRVVDTGAFDSPSALETRFGAGVDHELRRNIILSGYANLANYEYDGTNREDETRELGATVTYKMNKRVHWELFARNNERDVSGTTFFGDPSYGQTRFGIGLKLYP